MGVYSLLPSRNKPDHLVLVNSFFGLEPARDVPPNVVAIGPVLSDTYQALTPELDSFTRSHKRILYISLGTHVLLPDEILQRILTGAALALQAAGGIDGVIWSIRGMALKQFNLDKQAPHQLSKYSISDLVSGACPHILFASFVPQRALLANQNVSIFVTHAGASSTNEAAFHGISTITIGVYYDQITCAMKLRDAGVSIPLERDTFTPDDLYRAIEAHILDATGSFEANINRLQRIAKIASRRKYLAADLVEETLADFEGRKLASDGRAMHLETADMRMPIWKARNWDLQALGAGCLLLGIAAVVYLPDALRICLR
jgi:UDP:flavonoid glycosyltransferase YjiC (YdhE family)